MIRPERISGFRDTTQGGFRDIDLAGFYVDGAESTPSGVPDINAGIGIFRHFDLDDSTNLEFNLWTDWVNEQNKLFGADILYYRVESTQSTNKDQLYGEDPLEQFQPPKRCRATFEDINEPDRFWSAFGMMSDDVFVMTIPKLEFLNKIGSVPPKVGDVIKTMWNDINYEVIYIHQHPEFRYSSSVFRFTLKRFEFSYQEGTDNVQRPDSPFVTHTPDVDPNSILVSDTTSSEFWGADNQYIEEESDDIVDYDEHEILDDDIYGQF